MHKENSVYIRGPLSRIFELASNVENWPEILPHYRFVTLLERSEDERRRVVVMGAVRPDFPVPGSNFPVTWTAVQICDEAEGTIIFKHRYGIAQGMWVKWTLEADPWERGIKVTIAHDLRYPIGILNGWFAQNVVGDAFVSNIAGRTLATIKEIVEREELDKLVEQDNLT